MKKLLLSLIFLLVPSVLAQNEPPGLINLFAYSAYLAAFETGTFLQYSLVVVLFFVLLGFIFKAIALMIIAKKLDTQYAWLAWIPLVNIFLIVSMAKVHKLWALAALLVFVPIIGPMALKIISVWWWWKIAERRKFPGAISLLSIVPVLNLVMIGILAWGKD